jgi:DNA-binding CsgD family transcriptional regulator
MNHERLARLTEQQRVCLRLVFAHMTSKEIAPQLGIEPGSVDQHIKAAMRTLGAPDRRSAARMLAEYEGLGRPALAMHEEQEGFDATGPLQEPRLPLPLGGLRPDDVGTLKRLGWIAALTIGGALAFGALVSGAEALTRLLRGG